MEAHEIREQGKKIKNWTAQDGAWYYDEFEIWQVGEKYYQIQDRYSHSFSATMTFFGKVTEIEKPKAIPTHIGIVLASKSGKVWIDKQMQGTLDEISDFYDIYIKKATKDNSISYSFKTLELHF